MQETVTLPEAIRETLLNKKIVCKQCDKVMLNIIFGMGKNINVKGYHCEQCGMNYVNPLFLDKALELLQLYIVKK